MVTVKTADGRLVEGTPLWPDDVKDLMESVNMALYEHSYFPGIEAFGPDDPDGVLRLLRLWGRWLEDTFGFPYYCDEEEEPS